MMDAGEQARELRRAGHTIEQIKAALGTRSNRKLAEWLRGVPPDPSVHKARAKPDLRAQARVLRGAGKSYNAIAAELGVSKSSVSVWCRDVVLTDQQRAALVLPSEQARLKRAAATRAGRIRRTQLIQQEAAAEIGALSERELFLVGVALYWAEGSKQKPWMPSQRVALINSDDLVIRTFLAWLKLVGVTDAELSLRVVIHESADIAAATAYWADVAGVEVDRFEKPTLKRHNPRTVRKNTAEAYVGCLVVGVRRSTDLNRRIAGWWLGIAASVGQ
jgi:transposase